MDTLNTESLTTELREALDTLSERSSHWPFKRKATLSKSGAKKFGPPPGGERSVKKQDDWVCKRKGKYVQLCKGPNGQKKIVRIDPSYKAGYNAAYRAAKAAKAAKKKKK